MRKLLVHIGTSKTGTTAIQSSFMEAQRRGALSVCYPDFSWARRHPRRNPHAFLGYVYRRRHPPRVFAYKADDSRLYLEAQRQDFAKEFARALRENDRVVLSAESLSGMQPEEIRAFRDELRSHAFDRILVAVYVRNPAQIYLSSAQQKLKASSILRDPRKYRYRFREIIEKWSSAFDANVVVRPFERALLHQNCVVRDFSRVAADFFGCDVGPVETLDANVSLSAEGMAVMQKYRRAYYPRANDVHKPDSTRLVRLLAESQSALPQTKPRLRPEVASLILARHHDELAWLREKHGIDLGPAGNGSGAGWRPAHDALEVSDVVDLDQGVLEELLRYAWRCASAWPGAGPAPADPA